MVQSIHAMRSRMLIVALLVGSGLAAPAGAQDQRAATPSDTIYARKTVMDTISEKMDALEATGASDRTIDLGAAHEFADVISVLLMAFPHMFPTATNQWKPNVDKDPAFDTYAAPELWAEFSDFYKRAATPPRLPTMRAAPRGTQSSKPRSKNCAAPATAAMPPIRRPTERHGPRVHVALPWPRWSGAVDDAKTSRVSCT
jgi:hypothetical protein